MELPFPRTYVLGYVPRKYLQGDQKVPSVSFSCAEDSQGFSLVPRLVEGRKPPVAVRHLPGVGIYLVLPLKGRREMREQGFPVSCLKARYPWQAPLVCLVHLACQSNGFGLCICVDSIKQFKILPSLFSSHNACF